MAPVAIRVRRSVLQGAVLLALLAIVATACSSTAGSGSSAKPGGDAADVLDFSAPRLGGGTIDGASLAGEDVAFWFWAPW